MTKPPSLAAIRTFFAHRGLLLLFGAIYITSQVIIATIVDPLVPDRMVGLQVTGFAPEAYRAMFSTWEAEGVMQAYHTHLIFDDIHWIWYTLFLTTALALSMDAARLSANWNRVLAFPLLAGTCDWFENGLQHIFLSGEGYSQIVAPLPAISTCASIIKWILFLGSFVLIAVFQAARLRSPE